MARQRPGAAEVGQTGGRGKRRHRSQRVHRIRQRRRRRGNRRCGNRRRGNRRCGKRRRGNRRRGKRRRGKRRCGRWRWCGRAYVRRVGGRPGQHRHTGRHGIRHPRLGVPRPQIPWHLEAQPRRATRHVHCRPVSRRRVAVGRSHGRNPLNTDRVVHERLQLAVHRRSRFVVRRASGHQRARRRQPCRPLGPRTIGDLLRLRHPPIHHPPQFVTQRRAGVGGGP